MIFSGKSKISSPKGKLSKYELISSPNGKVRSVWKYGSKMIKILDLVELGGLIWASWDWILHRFWTIWPCSGPLARFGGPLRPQNHKRDVYRAFLTDLWRRERVWVSLWGQLRKICIYEIHRVPTWWNAVTWRSLLFEMMCWEALRKVHDIVSVFFSAEFGPRNF